MKKTDIKFKLKIKNMKNQSKQPTAEPLSRTGICNIYF